ncbi:MAG: nucleotidyltransferase domain-containing protein [Chloroflexi bacterium]|nr:nucleotidyltransferase domain-containing protein [Chloroflexota bacterium]MCI0578465.1 nucleotidyltransferase domain-containing protein [Chloroflexota bacterium]MCI0643911.1 nucleotidyltransferase domain-containing protein [Chloroflexota bacterium]MCI0729179.1 nucleotidyltransferase domain-containing protein [Chloroflexota bacterium]
MTPATKLKRKELELFVERVLSHESTVEGVVGIGSIATGRMRPDSDIDAVVFLDPLDWYVVPAEFIWRPSDSTFHSIFTGDPEVRSEGIQLNCIRLGLRQWANRLFDWPEPRRAELSAGWIVFDRKGVIAPMIAERTAYSEILRQERLDEAITWLDQHLGGDRPAVRWDTLGPAVAHDRLEAAYHYLVQALFAYNRHWLPWRNRQMDSLLQLPWLPENFAARMLLAANAPSVDQKGYLARAEELRSLFNDLLERLTAGGDYSAAPIDQAFIRGHSEPGYAWNMDDWNTEKLRRFLEDHL